MQEEKDTCGANQVTCKTFCTGRMSVGVRPGRIRQPAARGRAAKKQGDLKLLLNLKLLRVYEEKERKTKMKRLKKILAFVISCTMIFGTMSMMSFADPVNPEEAMVDPKYDESIKIMGLEAGDKVKLYKVLEWSGNADANSTDSYGGWKFAAGFYGKGNTLKDNNGNTFANDKKAIEYIIGDPAVVQKVEPNLTSAIAGQLAKISKSATPVNPAEDDQKVTGDTFTYAIKDDTSNNSKIGMYMAVITSADQNTVYNPVFISADFNTSNPSASWTVTSDQTYWAPHAAKKSTVSVDKKDNLGSNSYDQTWRSVRPGETVKFTVETMIPGYGEVYDNPFFKITDNLNGMKLKAAPVITEPSGAAAAASISGKANDTSFTVDFTTDKGKAYLKTVAVATKMTITYEAEITDDAPMNVNTESNEVWIEYSHNPQDEDDHDVKKDGTSHYTYTIDADLRGGHDTETRISGAEIVKVGVDAHGNPINETTVKSQVTEKNSWKSPLEGASFKLYTDSDCKNEYVKADGKTFGEITTKEDGRLTIAGLDAGTYYLKEFKAPNGYIKYDKAIKIKIDPTFHDETITEYYDETTKTWSYDSTKGKAATYTMEVLDYYDVYIDDQKMTSIHFYNNHEKEIKESTTGTFELPSSIPNTKGVELPATGGMGTTIFYVVGVILVLGAGILLVTRRRMDIQ